jgi:hypothetical protein
MNMDKYIEIEIKSKADYSIYKKYCESKGLKPKSYNKFKDDYSELIFEELEEKFGWDYVEDSHKLHGLKFKTSYHDSDYVWLNAFKVIDENVFKNTELYSILKGKLEDDAEDDDIYISEYDIEASRVFFKQKVGEFWGDD